MHFTKFECSTPSRFQDIAVLKLTGFLFVQCCHFVSIVTED